MTIPTKADRGTTRTQTQAKEIRGNALQSSIAIWENVSRLGNNKNRKDKQWAWPGPYTPPLPTHLSSSHRCAQTPRWGQSQSRRSRRLRTLSCLMTPPTAAAAAKDQRPGTRRPRLQMPPPLPRPPPPSQAMKAAQEAQRLVATSGPRLSGAARQ